MIMLAGINGAGKSTFNEIFLDEVGFEFINADAIAHELFGHWAQTPNEGREAQRLVGEEVSRAIRANKSFVRETVFSDPNGHKIGEIRSAADCGYLTILVYVGVSPELAMLRVEQRVREGGHDVERNKIHARFPRTLNNLANAIGLAQIVCVYDNSSATHDMDLVAIFDSGKEIYRSPNVPGWLGSDVLDEYAKH